ncbi:MAG TPA: hypothetical protein V6C97_32840 [Oculatellaceae cyanobacterium]
MRYLFTLLALMAGLTLGIPSLAQAAPTCKIYTGSGTGSWPDGVYFQYCGTATSVNASFVFQAFTNLPTSPSPNAAGNVVKSAMVNLYTNGAVVNGKTGVGKGYYGVVYLFHNPTEYLAWAKANGVDYPSTISSTAGGYTAEDPTSLRPYYTVIFEVTGAGVNNGSTGTHNILWGETVHEFGHWTDYLMSLYGNQTLVLSNSPMYQREIAQDFANLDPNPACKTSQGGQGVFTGRADYTSTNLPTSPNYYICNGTNGQTGTSSDGQGTALNTGYSGTNQEVLEKAWPEFFQAATSGKELYSEIFAEGFAAQWGPGDGARTPANADIFYGGVKATPQSFVCSKAWINYVTSNAKLPTASSNYFGSGNPNNCPLS